MTVHQRWTRARNTFLKTLGESILTFLVALRRVIEADNLVAPIALVSISMLLKWVSEDHISKDLKRVAETLAVAVQVVVYTADYTLLDACMSAAGLAYTWHDPLRQAWSGVRAPVRHGLRPPSELQGAMRHAHARLGRAHEKLQRASQAVHGRPPRSRP